MTAPDRATLIAAFRRTLDIAETSPDLPLPELSALSESIEFFLPARNAAAVLTALETAFAEAAGPITGGIAARSADRWVSSGSLAGIPVRINAPAAAVAERRVTGTRVVEDVEWVRRAVAPEGEKA